MLAVFYVWGLKQAFILQNVSEAQLDQHIWEPAQEDADNIWISKALHTKICLNTEEKYNTETQKPKIKNGKLKWQDSENFFFLLYCILSVSFLKCSAPSEWRTAVCWRPTRRTNTVQRRKRGVSEEGAAQEGRKAATKARILNHKHSSQTKPYGQIAAVLSPLGLPLFIFYNSNKIIYKRV